MTIKKLVIILFWLFVIHSGANIVNSFCYSSYWFNNSGLQTIQKNSQKVLNSIITYKMSHLKNNGNTLPTFYQAKNIMRRKLNKSFSCRTSFSFRYPRVQIIMTFNNNNYKILSHLSKHKYKPILEIICPTKLIQLRC